MAHRPLPRSLTTSHCAHFHSGAKGHAIQPIADHVPWLNGTRFANENEKRCLKCIFRVLDVVSEPPTDREHHGSVASHECLKRGPSRFGRLHRQAQAGTDCTEFRSAADLGGTSACEKLDCSVPHRYRAKTRPRPGGK